MSSNRWWLVMCVVVLTFFSTQTLHSQGNTALIDGVITDPQNAVVPGAKVILASEDTATSSTFISDHNGSYAFPAVVAGTYQLRVTAGGFAEFVQDGILVRVGYPVRLNVRLAVGATTQQVEVRGDASALNFENGEIRHSIDPEVIEDVPLLVSGGLRAAANFATIFPGVTRGTGEVWAASTNGGVAQNGTFVLDGENMWASTGSQGLTGASSEFPLSPDSLSEFQMVTSNYDAQYEGASGVVVENTKSGTDKFHGTLYAFNRNTDLNARPFGAPFRPEDIENDYGGNIGGPLKLPWIGPKVRLYFFGSFEGYKINGGLTTSTLSLPSAKEQQGDFSDWVDPSGNLIPVYDPATTRANPAYNSAMPEGPTNLPYLRNQFMGCNGNQPNVICASDPRLQSSLAKQWFQYLPTLSSSGPLNNFVAPPIPTLGKFYEYVEKVDANIGAKDHLSEMYYYEWAPISAFTQLPVPISNSGEYFNRCPIWRAKWEHTFNAHLINHVGFGYQNDITYNGGVDGGSANKLPQIPGVASHAYPSQINFGNGFASYGTDSGSASVQPWLGPNYVISDVVYLTKGKHSLDFGTDLRFSWNHWTQFGGQSGMFTFQPTETGLLGINSGNAIASFLLEQVDSAQVTYYGSGNGLGLLDGYQKSYAGFVSDTWHATQKLSLNAGLRYQVNPPAAEVNNHYSYFDPNLPNPGADKLPGAIAFAGSGPGRSGVRYPEAIWYGGISPRLGFSYAITPKTVVRAGYGLYDDFTNVLDFTDGISQDGFNTNATFQNSLGGLQPAFILSQGVPQTFPVPPQLTPTIDNGLNSAGYHPRNGNRSPYSQQWNLTVERQFTSNDYVTASYIGNRGIHLLSALNPLNALNPQYMASLGSSLYDVFQPGQATLDGVNAPFSGFATTMTGCAPSVAQALQAYPQYCNGIVGVTETDGRSSYNSFQVKAEHRFSRGMWALFSYTMQKQFSEAETPGGNGGFLVSPYQPERRQSLGLWDVPQSLNISYIYQLPFGTGKSWLNQGRFTNAVFGGWVTTGVYRFQGGTPFEITSSNCNVPSQIQATCLPGLLPGAHPYLQSSSHINVSNPFLNVAAFEPVSAFNFYTGYGRITQPFRQPGFNSFDTGLKKVFRIKERATFELRGDAFNVVNGHHFSEVHVANGWSAFTTDISSPAFGMWAGAVTPPRNIQVSGRISF